ncbi:hypothetical protein JMJ58_19590 [Haloterrigena salifodinae]|uniref:Uncharacterized protein n=1 Tax=Haloterrigena salifodinae TaxID=2675099 RepID=A0A8T8DZX4_9EURY|nr:hypothetical protein [Haloterrigena salifodinae]QRV15085.1 hypothetical protein JMJ58_19590 [Haloterrigena salifodinae]
MGRSCERCDETENVTRFALFGRGEPGGEEWLCWEHRWPYLRKRLHGPDAIGPPGSVVVPEPEPEPLSGQTGLADFL